MDGRLEMVARRVVAYAIDSAITLVALAVAYGIIEGNTGAEQGQPLPSAALALLWIVVPTIVFGYWTGFVGLTGATPGQRILRLEVQHANRDAVTPLLALRRSGAAIIAAAPCFFGYMWALIDREQRSWVDILTSTRIGRRTERAPSLTPPLWRSDPAQALSPSPPAESSPPRSEISDDVPRPLPMDLARVDAVADALEARGDLHAAALLARVAATRRHDEAGLARAGWLLAEGGWTLEALKHANDLATMGVNTTEVLAARAIGLAHHGVLEEAHAVLAEAYAHDANTIVQYAAVDVTAVTGHATEALAYSRHLTEQHPEWASAWCQRAEVALNAGDAADAVESARRAVTLRPWNVTARLVLARSLKPRGRRVATQSPEYCQALVDVLDLMPQNASARRQLLDMLQRSRRRRLLLAIRLYLAGAVLFGWAGVTGTAAPEIVGAVLIAGGAGASIWTRRVRSTIPPEARKWIDHLVASTSAQIAEERGFAIGDRSETATQSNTTVLEQPARCWCNVVEHLAGEAAVNYAQLHLVADGPPVFVGVYIMRCPDAIATYIGTDAGIADPSARATLMRVGPINFEASEPHTPRGYL